MKDKIAKILISVVLMLSTLMFLPWTYLTTAYYIARYAIFALMIVTLALTFSMSRTLSVRFVRLLALTIIVAALMMIFVPIRRGDIMQLCVALLTIVVGINLNFDEKGWLEVLYYYTICITVVVICNCLFFAGNLKVPEYYMVNEGKNQMGAMLAIGASACFFFGMKKKDERVALWAISFLAVLCMFIMRARSDFFASVVCIFLIVVKDAEVKFKPEIKTFLTVLVVATIIFIVYTGFISDEVHTFMFGGKNSANLDDITSRRLERNRQGLEILRHHNPIEEFGNSNDELHNSVKIPFIHNYALLRVVRYGLFSLPFLAFYIYFCIAALCEIFKSRRSSIKQVGWIVCSIPLIISFAEPNFPYGPGLVQLPALLLLGFSLKPEQVAKRNSESADGKVLHICNDFNNSKVHKNLYEKLDKNGVKQVVFVPMRKNYTENNRFDAENTDFVYSHILNPLHRLFFFHKIEKTVKNIEKNVDLSQVDICHATTLFSDGMVAFEIFRKYGIPYVVTVRNSDVNAFLKFMPHLWWVHRAVLQNAEKVVFVAPSLQKRLNQHFTLLGMRNEIAEKTVLQTNGIDDFWLQHIDENARDENAHNLVYVGNFSRNKNVPRLIKAVASLRQKYPDIHLDVVGGGGNQNQKVMSMVDNNKDFVTYYGQIFDKQQLQKIYKQNVLFAMPSKSETFGLVYIEALSQGLKILWSRGEAVEGMFEENVGESVNPLNVKDIASKIEQIFDNPCQYENLNPETFGKFSWNVIADKYKLLYEQILC